VKLEELEPKRTALIIVDMLNDFVRADGALVVPKAKELIPNQKKLLEKARKIGFEILFLADNHMPDDPEFEIWPKHCVQGTHGAKVIDELTPLKSEKIIPKRRYSGFFGTDLDLTLREADVERIILVGVLTDICVMYTSADASARNYEVIVISDATGTTDSSVQEFTLKHIEKVHNGIVTTTEKLLSSKIMVAK
jgi:nicotinamidase/pyrazinamidase